MAFTDFKNINAVKQKYPQIILKTGSFIPLDLPLKTLNPYFEEEITLNIESFRSNEFYASETLISPVLREVWKPYRKKLNLWTHQAIRFDDELVGIPDYMFSNLVEEQYEVLSYPLLTTVEAKAENFEEGWGQCLAQMLAFREINKNTDIRIYGIVATGKYWEFGKLEGDLFTKNTRVCSIDELARLVSILDFILMDSLAQMQKLN
jgi:hypothetical protein